MIVPTSVDTGFELSRTSCQRRDLAESWVVLIGFSDEHILALQTLAKHIHDLRRDFSNLRVLHACQKQVFRWEQEPCTDPWIDSCEDHLQPGQTLHDMCLERVRYCSSDGQRNERGELLKISWVATDKEPVKQFYLARRLKPLVEVSFTVTPGAILVPLTRIVPSS